MICIDARLYGIRHTGIGRYVENLISSLPKQASEQVSLIVPPDLVQLPQLSSFKKYVVYHHPYTLISQFEMLLLLIKVRPHLLHVPHFTIPLFWPGKIVVTIHDLIKHQSKGPATTTRSPLLYWLKYFLYLFISYIAVKKATRIIVPTQYWQRELTKRYQIPSDKIVVTYEGVDRGFFLTPRSEYRRPPYVVYTGNLYPHKNIPVLLQAIKLLSGKVRLKVVCSRSVFFDRLKLETQSLSLTSAVDFCHGLVDHELALLLNGALCFVTPSLIEGFGLPGLEAMASGTPVISSNASCLPEVYRQAAQYFDPTNPQELADYISRLLHDKAYRHRLILRGQRLSNTYTWEKMAKKTWQIYQET